MYCDLQQMIAPSLSDNTNLFYAIKGFDFFLNLVLGKKNIRISEYNVLIWNLI